MRRTIGQFGHIAALTVAGLLATGTAHAQSTTKTTPVANASTTNNSGTSGATQSVSVVSMPAVTLTPGNSVNIGNSPTVTIGNSPTVNIGNSPTVTIGNTYGTPVPVLPVITTRAFLQQIDGFFQNGGEEHIGGSGSGILGISSITADNASGALATFFLNPVTLSGGTPGTCTGSVVSRGQGVKFTVPALGTMHLTFPSPIVIAPSPAGQTCFVIDVLMTGSAASVTLVGAVQ